jgi:hypothetical protein
MPWKYQIAIAVKSEEHPEGIYVAYDTITIIDDETDDINDIKLSLDRIVALGVCGKIELTMEEFEEEYLDEGNGDIVIQPISGFITTEQEETSTPQEKEISKNVVEVKKDPELKGVKKEVKKDKDEKKK